MWEIYHEIIRRYPKIPFIEERRLIAQAEKGSQKNAEEIVLRHLGFVIFRLRRKLIPSFLRRLGEDLLSDSISILYQKITTYDLDYRDRQGNPKLVQFVSYIWKRIDGFITDSVSETIQKDKLERNRDNL